MHKSTESEAQKPKTQTTNVTDHQRKNEILEQLWAEISHFLEEAELKLHNFKSSIDKKAESLDATAQLSAAEFREFLHEGEVWFSHLVARMKQAGEHVETGIDTAKVKMHLAKMDSKDRAKELYEHVGRFTSDIENLASRTERETALTLKRLSRKCWELKEALLKR